jgi:hypothetical protein
LQLVARHRVRVNDGRHIVDKADDILGEVIARRGLAGEDLDPRRPVRARIGADRLPVGDGLEDVEMLALVFVQALDLDVEHHVGIERQPMLGCAHPIGEVGLVGALGLGIGGEEAGVVDMRLQLRQLLQIADPVLADPVGDDPRQRGLQDRSQRRGVTPLVSLPRSGRDAGG